MKIKWLGLKCTVDTYVLDQFNKFSIKSGEMYIYSYIKNICFP